VDTDAADKKSGSDRRPARTVSDIGEGIGSEDRATHNQSAPPRPYRSASHRLRRAQSYSAQCRKTSPEIIAEEDEKSCKVILEIIVNVK